MYNIAVKQTIDMHLIHSIDIIDGCIEPLWEFLLAGMASEHWLDGSTHLEGNNQTFYYMGLNAFKYY